MNEVARARPRFAERLLRVMFGRWGVFRGGGIAALAAILLVGNYGFSTPADQAYRNIDPASDLCNSGPTRGWTILSQSNVQNDETLAILHGQVDHRLLAKTAVATPPLAKNVMDEKLSNADQVAWRLRLRCAIQRHEVAWNLRYGPKPDIPVTYNLAFVEFKENGDPYPLARDDGSPYTLDERATHPDAPIGQIEALTRLVKRNAGHNYVIVFVHGWRNDASLGDGTVADLRVYAAQVARDLATRCKIEGRHCGEEVTAVFMGWRGARVDERKLRDWFGGAGDIVGELAAAPTLFDRKPVSELIAPSLRSALSAIDTYLKRPPQGDNHMIVFGHSLGGNMLMTAFKDELVKLVERHAFKAKLVPPVGDLVVLLNPASEAAKWTEIQRTVWRRLAIRDSDTVPGNDPLDSYSYFPADQKPAFISVTAALAWPPGGVRPKDCDWEARAVRPGEKIDPRQLAVLREIDKAKTIQNDGIEYDFATHDLFSAFKFDFRPLADRFERAARRWSAGRQKWNPCAEAGKVSPIAFIPYWFDRAAAGTLRNLPFMNTDQEQTETIGHLDPPRNISGDLTTPLISWRPFGTTHELSGLNYNRDVGLPEPVKQGPYCADDAPFQNFRHMAGAPQSSRSWISIAASTVWGLLSGAPTDEALPSSKVPKEKPVAYALSVGARACGCPATTGWLTRARSAKPASTQHGFSWDSSNLGPGDDPLRGHPALRFVHGFENAGIWPITIANDPFWNIRAFDDALALHDGFMLSSFICAMNALVMDDIVAGTEPVQIPPAVPTPAPPIPY